MLGNVMPVHGVQNCICLQHQVDCHMPTLHLLLKSISLRRTAQHCYWYLSPEWALSHVPIISLNSFKIIQTSQQGGTENGDMRVLSTRKWTIDLFHSSCENSNSNPILETGLLCKFVGRKSFALLLHFAVGAVHTQMGVIVNVDPPVIKINLKKNMLETL